MGREELQRREPVRVLVVRPEPREVAVHPKVPLRNIEGALDQRPTAVLCRAAWGRTEFGVIGLGFNQKPLDAGIAREASHSVPALLCTGLRPELFPGLQ